MTIRFFPCYVCEKPVTFPRHIYVYPEAGEPFIKPVCLQCYRKITASGSNPSIRSADLDRLRADPPPDV